MAAIVKKKTSSSAKPGEEAGGREYLRREKRGVHPLFAFEPLRFLRFSAPSAGITFPVARIRRYLKREDTRRASVQAPPFTLLQY